MRLADMKPKQRGIISAVNAHGAVQQRLLDLGLRPQTAITIARVALIGDPIWVDLLHSQVALRKKEAACITVETCTAAQ